MFCERVRLLSSRGIRTNVGATLHKTNYKTVRSMGRLATSLGASRFNIGFLCPVGRAKDLVHLVLDGSETTEAYLAYLDGIASGEYRGTISFINRSANLPNRLEYYDDILPRLPFLTEWPFSRMRIDPFGNTYTAGKLKGTDFSDGLNVLQNDIDKIWHENPNYRELRSRSGAGRIHGLDIRELPKNLPLL